MQTNFAAVTSTNKVVATRSSASRHVGGSGKFGPYTHCLTTTSAVEKLNGDQISWHGSEKLALDAKRTWDRQFTADPLVILPVVVTPKRMTPGQDVEVAQ